MKKLLLLLACWVICLFANAQEHLKFKNIPIDGSVENFVQKLKLQGYKDVATQNGFSLLTGDFADDNDVAVLIAANDKGIVYAISVMIDGGNSWSSLKAKYQKYKSALSEKYGKPSKVIEEFYSPYYEYDGYEISAFKNDKATYLTSFAQLDGNISVVIVAFNGAVGVTIVYQDAQNGIEQEKSDNDKIMNDI